MPDQPPDSSNCRDQEQGNDHALIVVAVTGPCKPPLRPWMRPEGRASAPHDSPSSSGQTQALDRRHGRRGRANPGHRPWAMFLARRTVQTHISHILAKFGAKGRVDTVGEALRQDISA